MRIRIADIAIEVCAPYGSMARFAADYLEAEEAACEPVLGERRSRLQDPVMRIETTQEDIEAERSEEFAYSDGYLETLAVLRKIAEAAPDFDAFLMHGATIGYRGRSYAFLAPSGTGKSTHIKLWLDALGDEVQVINGDKPIVRLRDGEFTAYGTPYNGKERWGSNTSAPLGGICILERGGQDELRRLSLESDGPFIVEHLLQQVYIPRDPARAAKLLALLDALSASVPFWHLRCTPTPAAFEAAFRMAHVA